MLNYVTIRIINPSEAGGMFLPTQSAIMQIISPEVPVTSPESLSYHLSSQSFPGQRSPRHGRGAGSSCRRPPDHVRATESRAAGFSGKSQPKTGGKTDMFYGVFF